MTKEAKLEKIKNLDEPKIPDGFNPVSFVGRDGKRIDYFIKSQGDGHESRLLPRIVRACE